MEMNETIKKADEIGRGAIEITVVLKDSERTYRHKFLIYEDVTMSRLDPIIQDCIREARLSFKEMPEDIVIKASMVVQ